MKTRIGHMANTIKTSRHLTPLLVCQAVSCFSGKAQIKTKKQASKKIRKGLQINIRKLIYSIEREEGRKMQEIVKENVKIKSN